MRPPATPMSLAATSVPTAVDRFGAILCIFCCTSCRIWILSESSCKATTAASSTFCRVSGDSSCPEVVEAVTDTTMIVAWGKTSSRLTIVRSISLPADTATLGRFSSRSPTAADGAHAECSAVSATNQVLSCNSKSHHALSSLRRSVHKRSAEWQQQ